MWIEKLTGPLEQKKEYRRNQARLDALPEPYRAAAKALQRYLMAHGGILDGETLVRMQGDFVDLWDRAAADGSTIRDIVGDDPASFADDFAAAYTGRRWIDRERQRLADAIDALDVGRSEPER
jgi:DNA-binding ferritin-like protein (Dps family)